jgi:hypothetical protein
MKNLMEYFEIYHLLIWNRQNLINFFDTHTVTWTLWVMFSLCQGQEWQEGKSLQASVLCQTPMCMSIWQGPLARTNWASCLYKAREILFHALLLYVFQSVWSIVLIDFCSLIRPLYTLSVRAQKNSAPTLSIFGLLFGRVTNKCWNIGRKGCKLASPIPWCPFSSLGANIRQ